MTDKKITVHSKIFNIHWGDMDALGHVNNVRYFDYFQEARFEWLQEIELPLTKKTGPVVIHVACTFLKPVIYPATLSLESSISHLGHSSMVIDHDLYQNDVLMAQGVSKVVWVDYTTNQSIPIPDVIRNLYTVANSHTK